MMMAPPHWSSRTMLMAWLMQPFAWIYRTVTLLRVAMVRPTRLHIPVICVGNNTAGGAGKTPTVIALCQWLQAMGKNPHVISRGYKNRSGTYVLRVDPAVHSAIEVGDEPLLIARSAPCWIGKRRIPCALAAIREGADVIIMDDGLQNPSIVKDVAILVVDGSYGFGNRFMLPAGPCREPVAVSMAKSDMVLIMGNETNPSIRKQIPPGKPVFNGSLQHIGTVNLQDKPVHPFAGIAHPDKFFATVRALGGIITLESRFPDHHLYTQRDIDRLKREAAQHLSTLVTTEKDYVRLPESFRKSVIAIPVALQMDDEHAFLNLISEALIS